MVEEYYYNQIKDGLIEYSHKVGYDACIVLPAVIYTIVEKVKVFLFDAVLLGASALLEKPLL